MKRWLAMVVLVGLFAGCDWQVAVPPPTTPPTVMSDEIARLVAEVLGVPLPAPATTLAELGVDELDVLDLVAELETRFSISIPEEDLTGRGESDPESWSRLTIEDLTGIVSRRLLDDPGLPDSQSPGPQSPGGKAGIVAKVPDDGAVGLQMWWISVNDNFTERVAPVLFAVPPTPGSYAVLDAEQVRTFRFAAQGDRRASGLLRLPALTLPPGQPCGVPSDSTTSAESTGLTVQAKRIGAGVCEIGLKWAKSPDGPKEPAPIVATVPAGSTLVVNTREMRVGYAAPSVSRWDRL